MSTLMATERRLAPFVLATHWACALGGLLLLATSFPSGAPWYAWAACALSWFALTASNALYQLRHTHPTVGMAPVSLASLGPAAVPALLRVQTTMGLRALCLILLAISLLVAALFGFWFALLSRVYHNRGTATSDAVAIVLGGAIRNGVPRPTLANRLDTAAHWYEECDARVLVLSGGPVPDEEVTEAAAMARYLMLMGEPQERMLLERQALNTRQNIEFSLELVRSRGLTGQLCVLTSDYHLYRAITEGRRLGVDLFPIPAPTPLESRLQQWCREVLTILAKR